MRRFRQQKKLNSITDKAQSKGNLCIARNDERPNNKDTKLIDTTNGELIVKPGYRTSASSLLVKNPPMQVQTSDATDNSQQKHHHDTTNRSQYFRNKFWRIPAHSSVSQRAIHDIGSKQIKQYVTSSGVASIPNSDVVNITASDAFLHKSIKHHPSANLNECCYGDQDKNCTDDRAASTTKLTKIKKIENTGQLDNLCSSTVRSATSNPGLFSLGRASKQNSSSNCKSINTKNNRNEKQLNKTIPHVTHYDSISGVDIDQTAKYSAYPVELCHASLVACNDAINAANLLSCLHQSQLQPSVSVQLNNQPETTGVTTSSTSLNRSHKASFFSSVKSGYNYFLQKRNLSSAISAGSTQKLDKHKGINNLIPLDNQNVGSIYSTENFAKVGTTRNISAQRFSKPQNKLQPNSLHVKSNKINLLSTKGSSSLRESVLRSPYFNTPQNVTSTMVSSENEAFSSLSLIPPNIVIPVSTTSLTYSTSSSVPSTECTIVDRLINEKKIPPQSTYSSISAQNYPKSINIPVKKNSSDDVIINQWYKNNNRNKGSQKIEQVTSDELAIAVTQHLRSSASTLPISISTIMHAASTSDDVQAKNITKNVNRVNTIDNNQFSVERADYGSSVLPSATISPIHYNCCVSAKHAQILGSLVENDIKLFRQSIESQQNELHRIQQACLNRERRKTNELYPANSELSNILPNKPHPQTFSNEESLHSVVAELQCQKLKLEQKNQMFEESLRSAHKSLDALRHQLRTNEDEWNTQRTDFRNSLKVLEKELEQVIQEKAQAQMMWAQVCDEKKKLEMSTEHRYREYNTEINELRAKCNTLEIGCSDLRENLKSERLKHQKETNEWLDFQRDLQTAVRVANDLKLEAEERAKNLELEISRLKRMDEALNDNLFQSSSADLKSSNSLNECQSSVSSTSSKNLTAEASSSYINYDLAGRIPIKDIIKRIEDSVKSNRPSNVCRSNVDDKSKFLAGKSDLEYGRIKTLRYDQRKQVDKKVHKRHFSCNTVSEFALNQESLKQSMQLEGNKNHQHQSSSTSSSSNNGTTTDDVKFITRSQSLNHGRCSHLRPPSSSIHGRTLSPSNQLKSSSLVPGDLESTNTTKTDLVNCWPLQSSDQPDAINTTYGNFANSQVGDDKYNILSLLAMKYQHKGSRRNALLKWCRERTSDYKEVNITNFSSCWTDGTSLIALLHSFLPDQINYHQLMEQDNAELKFRTAFSVAEKQGIKTTLDLNDILHSERPSWEPIMDYVTEIYRRFGHYTMPAVSMTSISRSSLSSQNAAAACNLRHSLSTDGSSSNTASVSPITSPVTTSSIPIICVTSAAECMDDIASVPQLQSSLQHQKCYSPVTQNHQQSLQTQQQQQRQQSPVLYNNLKKSCL